MEYTEFLNAASPRNMKIAVKYALLFLMIFWIGFVGELATGFNLQFLAIVPLYASGIIGVFSSPLIHGGITPLLVNSIPLVVLGFLLFLFYRRESIGMLFAIWLTAGLFIWLIGKPVLYFGSASIIFALGAFLFMAGCKTRKTILISLPFAIVVVYALISFLLAPEQSLAMWEIPFSGTFSGVLWSFGFEKTLKDVFLA